MSELWIGTSGYVYPHWRRGVFYPEGCASGTSSPGTPAGSGPSSSTIRSTACRSRRPSTAGAMPCPRGSVFAVKASRYITHVKRLRDTAEPLALFLERASLLGPSSAPSSSSCRRPSRPMSACSRRFLEGLPADRRWVIEFRHPSWHTAEVYETLAGPTGRPLHPGRRAGPARPRDHRALRLHPDALGRGRGRRVHPRAARVVGRTDPGPGHAGKDCYVYFNNDRGGHAPRDARTLIDLLDPAR